MDPQFFVFDIESVADGALVSSVQYPGEGLTPRQAVDRFRAELMEQYNSDFIPHTFQVPISVVVAKVARDYRLLDIVALDEPAFRPHVITEKFWRGWEAYQRPTLVTFNGRSFDLPVLELAAFRYGIPLPGWFDLQGKSYQQPRNRYNVNTHLDLHDQFTNFGASRFRGGLNLAANLLGKPGKIEVQGNMVQDLFHEGRLEDINHYCRCDVLDTYFVFLRCSVMYGLLTLEREHQLVEATRSWLEERAGETPAFAQYLEHWGDWKNPWVDDEAVAE